MAKEEKSDKKSEAMRMCICGSCPSFKECKEKKAFCFIGKSKCINLEKGCLCAACPVTSKFGLGHGYYCIRGKDSEQ